MNDDAATARSRARESRELDGKVALVTGGAVAINTRRSRGEADALVEEIRLAGGEAGTWIADVADGAAVRQMADGVLERHGRVDILVLNASIRREVAFKDMTFEQWREIM